MKVKLFRRWTLRTWQHAGVGVMLGLVCMAPTGANAWVATAIDDKGHTFTYCNAETAEDARAHALARCLNARGENAGCKPWAADSGKAIVIVKGIRSTGAVEVVENNHVDPAYAARAALAQCGNRARGCRIVLAEWDRGPTLASAARGGNTVALSLDNATESDALARALDECRRTNDKRSECEVVGAVTRSGQAWYAQAHQIGEGLADRATGFYMSPNSREEGAGCRTHPLLIG